MFEIEDFSPSSINEYFQRIGIKSWNLHNCTSGTIILPQHLLNDFISLLEKHNETCHVLYSVSEHSSGKLLVHYVGFGNSDQYTTNFMIETSDFADSHSDIESINDFEESLSWIGKLIESSQACINYCYLCVPLSFVNTTAELLTELFEAFHKTYDIIPIIPGNYNWAYFEFAEPQGWNSPPNDGIFYLLLRLHYKMPFIIVRDRFGKLEVLTYFEDENDEPDTDDAYDFTPPIYCEDLSASFRSYWEANIARILNFKGIKWQYEVESLPIKYGDNTHTYLPDFWLDNGFIIEVKGFWNPISREKVIALADALRHPQLEIDDFNGNGCSYRNRQLLILDGDMYGTLEQLYCNILPKWDESSYRVDSSIITIVGMKYNASKKALDSLKEGCKVLFEREPDNVYDEFAVKATNETGNMIGRISKDWSFIIASKMDLGMTFEGHVTKILKSSIKVRVQRTNPSEIIVYDFLRP